MKREAGPGVDNMELGSEVRAEGDEHRESEEVEVEHGFLPCWAFIQTRFICL